METENRGSEEAEQVFKKFYDDSANRKCFDCGAEAREFISVNNACSLCETCAGVHRSFGEHISHVKSIKSTEWAANELKLLERGGNAKLKEFFDGYTFDPKAAPIFKYKTLAAFYYRRRLRFAAEGKEHPELPDKERHLEQHENESFFDSITAGLSKVGSLISGFFSSGKAEEVKEAAKDKAAELKDDAKDLASKAADKKDEVAKDLKETKENVKETLEEKKTEVSEKLESGAEEIKEKAGGLREKLHDAKEKAMDMASKAVEFVKEKAVDMKDALLVPQTFAPEGIADADEGLQGKFDEKKAEASAKLEKGAEAVQEKAGSLREKLSDAKDRAVDMASKGIEAVKEQVSNAVEYIKEKTAIPEGEFMDPMTEIEEHRAKGELKEKDESKEYTETKPAGKEGGEKTEETEKFEAPKGLSETVADAAGKAKDLASKGLETVKEQLSNAVDFIKEKANIETKKEGDEDKNLEKGDSKEDSQARLHSDKYAAENRELLDAPKKEAAEREKDLEVGDVVHKTEEQLKHEKEIAEKKAKEEKELQEIANEAAESIKTQTMPHTTKSKADQIREQAAMIEAARGKTRVSKGKGVKKQIVQKGSADPEYIEKLQHLGEEGHKEEEDHEEDVEEHEEEHLETTQETKKTEQKEIPQTQEKRAEPEKKETQTKSQKETKESGNKGSSPKCCTETDMCDVHKKEQQKQQQRETADQTHEPEEEKFVDTSGTAWREHAKIHTEDIIRKNSGDIKEFSKVENLGQQVKEKAQAGLETLKEKTKDAAEWVQDKIAPEEQKLNLQESKGINANSKLNETEETKNLKENVDKIKENAGSLTENLKGKVSDAAGWVKDKVETLGKPGEQAQMSEEEQKKIEQRHLDAQKEALQEKSAAFDSKRPAELGRMTEPELQKRGDPNGKEPSNVKEAEPDHPAGEHPTAEYGRCPEPVMLRKHSHPEESPSKTGTEERKEGEYKEKSAPKAQ